MLHSREIKARLISAGVTFGSLARKCRVGKSTISMILWKKGRSRKVQQAIADALDMKFEDVWGNQSDPKSAIVEKVQSGQVKNPRRRIARS